MAVSSPTGNIFADAAVLAADAYGDTPSGQSLGWRPLEPADLNLSSSGTFGAGSYSFADGVYVGSGASNSGVAHVYEGDLNGETTLALAFRGTDEIPGDLPDHLHFTDHYAKFQPLISAIETYVNDPAHGIDHVLVTGHSLGSGMVTTAMVEEGWVNDPKYLGVAIASHGTDASVAAMAPAEVTNLVNFVHTQDFLVLAQDNGLPGSTLAAAATGPSFGEFGEFEPKARVGSEVWIDTGNAVRLVEDGSAGNFEDPVTAEHRIGRYEADITTLAQQGALDPNAIQDSGPHYFAAGTDGNDNFAQDQVASDPHVNAELFPTKDFDQQIFTGAGDDRIGGSGGNDVIDGGAGSDTAYFRGPAAAYTIMPAADGTVTVADTNPGSGPSDGTDTLRNIEVLHFADGDRTASGAVLADSTPPDHAPITLDNLINDPSVTLLAIRDEIAHEFDHLFS